MAEIIKSLSLDVSLQNRIQAVVAKQYDKNSRFLKIQMTDEGRPISVEQTSVVTINASRADNTYKMFAGKVNGDGTVTVPITYWMLELDDKVSCDISVVDVEGRKLSTLNFTIEVERSNYTGDGISDDENYDLLLTLLEEVTAAKSAEDKRVTAENARIAAENARVENEEKRVAEEQNRISAEDSRVSAEDVRVTSEQARDTNETARQSAEENRATAETEREAAEDNRATAETGRVNAENARVNAENLRSTDENTRNSNETARSTAESARVTAETERAAAETARQNAEQNRAAAWANAEGIQQIVIKDLDNNKQYGYQLKIEGGKPKLYISELQTGEDANV